MGKSVCIWAFFILLLHKQRVDVCREFCKSGSYPPTGLAPCLPCDKGFYQDMDGQRNCLRCAVNQTTSSEGSNSSMLCGEPCPPGSFSSTGLAPCSLCDRRSFQPRNESQICFPCPGSTITLHPGSRWAQDCVEINECESDPCSNNSTCTNLIGDYLCSCISGYTGKQCETNMDECRDQPCFNNGTCHDLINNYTCTCARGFRGLNFEDDINECDSSPCANNASCQNLPGGYKCRCEPGYTGTLCDTGIDDCLLYACQNGGTCRDGIDNYECVCAWGFQGDNCEENIDDCAGNPCNNGGQCLDGVGSHQCTCLKGFTGNSCDIDIDECLMADCKNNATCIDKLNGYFCKCEMGFSGKKCEIDIDECSSNPCKNLAKCSDMVNGYICACQDGFHGLHCENNIDDCATFPCLNNGSCHDGINSFICACPPGFTGELCNVDIDYCTSKPCFNNGSCLDDTTSFTCQCADGFEGEHCEVNVDDCKNTTCMNYSTCIDGINEYKCLCAKGFVGISCEINVDDCAVNPCVNHGTCIDVINDYQCNCKLGYTGKNCSVDINECASSPCHNNATCVDKVYNYTCICSDGYSGAHCEVNIDECAEDYCNNGSICSDGVNGYSCECAPGFSGDDCSTKIDECASFPCDYGGTCYDQVDGFFCTCKRGFTGQWCNVNIDECVSSPCQNNGTCLDLVANYSCQCPVGFNGSHCETPIDFCSESGNCTVNGRCINSRTDFYCNCSSGYFGKYCEFEIDECLANPCFNNASCHDNVDGFTCSCLDGFTGRLCELNIDDCVSNSCLNNATCVDRTLGYSCLCSDGYNGTFCQAEINECESTPCLNNGSCIDLTPGYKCNCFDKFIGENCENLTDLCFSAPCQNGGVLNHSPRTVLASNVALLPVVFLWAILIFMYFRKRRAVKSPNRPGSLLQPISLDTIEVNHSGTFRGNPSRNPVKVRNETNLWNDQIGLHDCKGGNCLPNSFPTVPVSKYITQLGGYFSSSGGELSAARDSDVKIVIGKGAFKDTQWVFCRVVDDETELLRDIPVGPEETLISPVVETGPHDINISKPLEIIIPHCLFVNGSKKNKKKWISVYRTDPGPIKWEKIPYKDDHSKAWFTVTEGSIHIKTKTFSFWSIFFRRGTRRKRARVFANKPNPRSVHLRFYIYDDNMDSRRRVEIQEKRLLVSSTPTIERPFVIYDNGSETINVRLTDLNEDWKLRTEAEGHQEFFCRGSSFRCEGACEIVLKKNGGGVGTGDDFDCTIKFQQEGRDEQHTMIVIPNFQSEKKPEPVTDPRQNSTETGDPQVTPTAKRHFNGAAGGSRSSAPEEGDRGNFDEKSRTPSVGACKSPSSGESSSATPQLVDDDHPVTEKICLYISHEVGSSWKNLLRELDLTSATIEQLEDNYSKVGVAEVCFQGLLFWIRKSGANATCRILREALASRPVGRSNLLEQIIVKIV